MCYLCQPRGDKARKVIQQALAVWKCKQPKAGEYAASWGTSHDWTLPSTKTKSWGAQGFAAYQKRTRYRQRSCGMGTNQLPSWGDNHNWSPYA